MSLEAVTSKPRLVRDPFLVNVLIHPGHDPEHLPGPVGHHDVAAHTVQDIDGLGLAGLPGPRHEGVGLGSESSNGAQIDHVARELRHEHLLDVGADLHLVAATSSAEVFHSSNLGAEPDTPAIKV